MPDAYKWMGITFAIGVALMVLEVHIARKKKEGFTRTDRQRLVGIFGLIVFFTALVGFLFWGFSWAHEVAPGGARTVLRHRRVQSARAIAERRDPGEVREKLPQIKETFTANELTIITITGDYERRRTSYRLVAKAFA